jgi:hypothetical protein
MKVIITTITVLAISLGFTKASEARIITSISPPTGAGLGDVFCLQVQTNVDTPFPNNIDSTASNQNQIANLTGLSCSPKTFQAIAPIDTQLLVEPSQGTTKYLAKETVVNQTTSVWDGYNFEIGVRADGEFASPAVILVPPGFAIPSFGSNALEFTSSKFTQLLQDGSFNLGWSGGSVAPGESVDFTFSIDVPDDLNGNNFYNSFTIRQLPIAASAASVSIPEPTSTLSFLGLLGLFGCRLARKYKLN